MIDIIGIDPKELYEFLSAQNIRYFFHANTVRTSCTFIEEKGLLSRGAIEAKGLIQTPQSSDEDDKQFNVWNDIFFDLVDLHGYFPRQNLYGPVCFVLNNSLLLDPDLPNICITKNNPIYWESNMSDIDKYYASVQEYIDEFEDNKKKKCIHRKMFTIHDTFEKISFEKYLEKIILDNPKVSVNHVNLYREAKRRLVNSLKVAGSDESILHMRVCSNCFCCRNYLNQVEVDELHKLF